MPQQHDFDTYFTYGPDQQREISFPLGGIGTGSIGLSGSGRLIDWEIRNRPNKGSVHGFTHFAVRAEQDGEVLDTRILHGPFDGRRSGDIQAGPFRSFGFGARREYLAGMPSFAEVRFHGFFPSATLEFNDPKFPGKVRLTALSPFIPGDARNSSLPVAMFEIEIVNTGERAIDYTVLGTLASFEGLNQDSRIETSEDGGGSLTFAGRSSKEVASEWMSQGNRGDIALTFLEGALSYQHHWFRGNWFDNLHVYWQDISRGGRLRDRRYADDGHGFRTSSGSTQDHGTIASHMRVAPGESGRIRAFISWHFPVYEKYWPTMINLEKVDNKVEMAWHNYYATQWPTISAVQTYCREHWDELWGRTVTFRDALAATTLPLPVLDAVSANLSVLRSPTVARLSDGTFYGFEGCHVDAGSCEGTCSHVWNYQQALPFLFPQLAQSVLAAEFEHAQHPATGGLGFRLPLPIGIGVNGDRPAADGHYGSVMKAYREWQISGDDTWLRQNWDRIKKAIAFAWHPANPDKWDPERTGVLWGRQHHTLDMELFGPNSWLTGFYLGGLAAGVRIAEHVGDTAAAGEYRSIFERGRAWVDQHLFNGRHFVQLIDLNDRHLLKAYDIRNDKHPAARGSIFDLYWSEEHRQIKYQIKDGSSIDQVLAQWHASLYGLGDLFAPDKVRSALIAVYETNFQEDLGEVANPCRVYGVAGESGTLICAFADEASAPAIPIPYAQETQHGYEYAFGCSLLQVGEFRRGVRVIKAVRDRYRGGNRNPWNEIECGSNYARSMASYAAVPILSGFRYSHASRHIEIAPMVQQSGTFRSFWSAGESWGEFEAGGGILRFRVLRGSLDVAGVSFRGAASNKPVVRLDGKPLASNINGQGTIGFRVQRLGEGSELIVEEWGCDVSRLPEIRQLVT